MLGLLEVPYRDTSARALAFALDEPRHDALAVAAVAVAGLTVELRLLGASHQVAAGPVLETVACLPGRDGGLPPRAEAGLDGWRYAFTSRTRDAVDFPAALAEITALLDRPDALSGVFPGDPGALTGIVVDPCAGGVVWRTWHTYPGPGQIRTGQIQTGQIVETSSRLVRAGSA
ncbi:DUF2617 family protein [Actinocorallia sp. A-T 12471]|uniref:DUF2617 family protein n=1 Tax=Actinocorallia sp. A-T 12471 TaxID=3089813 RepID=UPI0029CE5101|nr:DUF2617 family protein [Actinocorallia sp. A-T 12471]MDX6738682.1 DUF2617 family protein [Actinocorallia sp. A-T 12471]